MSSESDNSSEIEDPEQTEENIIKILVAGDINLGYEQSIKKGIFMTRFIKIIDFVIRRL